MLGSQPSSIMNGMFLYVLTLFIHPVLTNVATFQNLHSVSSSEVTSPIRKSPLDDNIYTVEYLNGFTVVYVENNKYTTASLAFLLNVGIFQDPAEIPGLAHFVEHMMFIESDNHQKNRPFEAYVSYRGGFSNAMTANNYTLYYFSINSKYLLEATEKFTHFFISPMNNITEKTVDIAINEIDAEFKSKKRAFGRRIIALVTDMMKDGVAVKKFGCGNVETLSRLSKSEMVEAACNFVLKNYRNTKGILVVCSNKSLEYMRHVGKLFGKIPRDYNITNNTGTYVKSSDTEIAEPEISNVTKNLLKEDVLSKIIYYKSIVDEKVLTIVTYLPLLKKYQKNGLLVYIKWLFMSQEEGTLTERLKNEGHASMVDLSFSDESGFTCMYLSIALMNTANSKKALSTVYKYLKSMLADKTEYEKIKQILAQEYKYKGPGSSTHVALGIAVNSLKYPIENVMDNEYVLGDFDADLINKCISSISDITGWIVLVSVKEYNSPFSTIEKYHGIEYSIGENCTDWLDVQVRDFDKINHIGEVDPDSHSLLEGERSIIRRISQDGEINFVFDSDFRVPSLYIEILLLSEDAMKNSVVYIVYFMMIFESFRQKFERSVLSGNTHFGIELRGDELAIVAYGFTKNVIEITKLFFDYLKADNLFTNEPDDLAVRKGRFEAVRDLLINQYGSIINANPYQRIQHVFVDWLMDNSIHEEKLKNITELRIEDVKINKKFFIQMTAIGNAGFSAIKETFRHVQNKLDGPATKPAVTIRKFKKIKFQTYDLENNAVGLFYEINPYTHDPQIMTHIEVSSIKLSLNNSYDVNSAIGILVVMISKHKFFDDVRRTKKMGYVANCNILRIKSAEYLVFLVQSSLSTDEIKAEILSCVEGLKEMIRSMDPSDFESIKESTADLYLSPHEEMTEFCNNILRGQLRGHIDLDYNKKMAKIIMQLTKESLLSSEMWKSYTEVKSQSDIKSIEASEKSCESYLRD